MKNDRFIIESNGIWDKEKGEEQLTWRELCNLLNELYIENKKLKEKIEIYEKCISSSHSDGKNPDK